MSPPATNPSPYRFLPSSSSSNPKPQSSQSKQTPKPPRSSLLRTPQIYRRPPTSTRGLSSQSQFAATPRFSFSQRPRDQLDKDAEIEEGSAASSPPLASSSKFDLQSSSAHQKRREDIEDETFSDQDNHAEVEQEDADLQLHPISTDIEDAFNDPLYDARFDYKDTRSPSPHKRRRFLEPSVETLDSVARKGVVDAIQISSPPTEEAVERVESPSPTRTISPRAAQRHQRTISRHSTIHPTNTSNNTRFIIPTTSPPPATSTNTNTAENHKQKRSFILPPLHQQDGEQDQDNALPDIFSPSRRKGNREYIRDGFASTVREWVLEMGSLHSQSRLRRARGEDDARQRVRVLDVKRDWGVGSGMTLVRGLEIDGTEMGCREERGEEERRVFLIGEPGNRSNGSRRGGPDYAGLGVGSVVGLGRLFWEVDIGQGKGNGGDGAAREERWSVAVGWNLDG